MALDKLVDSGQLDSDLEDVADAIRAKGGTSASLAFPAGFISAIGDIPTGGGGGDYVAADWLDYSKPTGRIVSNASTAHDNILAYRTGITSVFVPEWTSIPISGFNGCASLVTFVGAKVAGAGNTAFYGCSDLEAVDILGGSNIGTDFIRNCSKAATIILRSTSLTTLSNINSFRGSRYASNGAGGTIYIPKVLYDHLGDGSALDYKNATTWSTLDGYGKTTWAKIEGSIYETQYVDGTTIPTS